MTKLTKPVSGMIEQRSRFLLINGVTRLPIAAPFPPLFLCMSLRSIIISRPILVNIIFYYTFY